MVQGTTLVQLITLSVPSLVEVELGCDNISSECLASNPNYYHIDSMLTWFKFSSIESGLSVSVIEACWLVSSFYPDSKETIWFVEVDYFGSPEIFEVLDNSWKWCVITYLKSSTTNVIIAYDDDEQIEAQQMFEKIPFPLPLICLKSSYIFWFLKRGFYRSNKGTKTAIFAIPILLPVKENRPSLINLVRQCLAMLCLACWN